MKLFESRVSGIIDVVLYHEGMYACINYNVFIEPHKTRGQSHPPFLIYALANSGSGRGGDLRYQHKYGFFHSEILYAHHLHI